MLFDALCGGEREITRQRALEMTNQDLIDSLPKNRRAAAVTTLAMFCEGWNATFPQIAMIQCHPNTYRDVRMGPASPLALALPCAQQGADGEGLGPVDYT